ncbi:hypothetical protein HYT52_05395 [Candidatus Woesearchaeota archaeon]|nr:hypothetical protein [Candidatus Woesearchaeota archaeon]
MSFHYLDFTDNPQDFIIPSERLTECLEDGDWNLERTFDGRRMSRERLMQYLGLQSEQEFINWLMERGLRE